MIKPRFPDIGGADFHVKALGGSQGSKVVPEENVDRWGRWSPGMKGGGSILFKLVDAGGETVPGLAQAPGRQGPGVNTLRCAPAAQSWTGTASR